MHRTYGSQARHAQRLRDRLMSNRTTARAIVALDTARTVRIAGTAR